MKHVIIIEAQSSGDVDITFTVIEMIKAINNNNLVTTTKVSYDKQENDNDQQDKTGGA